MRIFTKFSILTLVQAQHAPGSRHPRARAAWARAGPNLRRGSRQVGFLSGGVAVLDADTLATVRPITFCPLAGPRAPVLQIAFVAGDTSLSVNRGAACELLDASLTHAVPYHGIGSEMQPLLSRWEPPGGERALAAMACDLFPTSVRVSSETRASVACAAHAHRVQSIRWLAPLALAGGAKGSAGARLISVGADLAVVQVLSCHPSLRCARPLYLSPLHRAHSSQFTQPPTGSDPARRRSGASRPRKSNGNPFDQRRRKIMPGWTLRSKFRRLRSQSSWWRGPTRPRRRREAAPLPHTAESRRRGWVNAPPPPRLPGRSVPRRLAL